MIVNNLSGLNDDALEKEKENKKETKARIWIYRWRVAFNDVDFEKK